MLGLGHGLTDAALPVWVVGALGLLLVAAALLVLQRAAHPGAPGHVARGSLVLVGMALAWVVSTLSGSNDTAATRRALNARSAELTARAIGPGSPLACLDAVANSAVEAACEKALFANPETIAAAISYVDARLALLIEGRELAARDRSYWPSLARLRLAIERDRYGFVAQALTARGCKDAECPLLKLLGDDNYVVSNLKERTFDANVVLHAGNWGQESTALAAVPPAAAVPAAIAPAAAVVPADQTALPAVAAAASPVATGSIPASHVAPGTPVSSKYSFPSAASIPAISIMNAEPTTPPPPAPAAASPPTTPPAAPSDESKIESKAAPRASSAPRRQSAHEPKARQQTPHVPLPSPPPPPSGNSSSQR